MMRVFAVMLLACAGWTVNAGGGEKDAAKADLKKLQGTWTLVSMEMDGKKAPPEAAEGIKAVVEGNKVTISFKGEVKSASTFTVDASKKPKTMDATAVLAPNKGKKAFAIYELDGDTFKICTGEGNKRPAAFATKEGSGFSLMVWKRAR